MRAGRRCRGSQATRAGSGGKIVHDGKAVMCASVVKQVAVKQHAEKRHYNDSFVMYK